MRRHTDTYKTQDIVVHVEQRWFPVKVLITSAEQKWPIDQYEMKGFPTEKEAADYGIEAAKWRIDHPATSGGSTTKHP